MATPTSRTLAYLRKQGYTAEVVEKWNPFSRTRKDLFNFADIVAIGSSTVGVQCTSTGNMSARVKKIIAEPKARIWLEAGNTIFVIGWSKKGAKGKRKVWTERIVEITLKDLDVAA